MSEPSSGLRPASPDGPELDAPAPAAVPAGWQVNFKFVAGTAFHPRASTMTWDYGNTGCTYATADQYEVMAADFQLPDGAIVDYLRIYYYDAIAADSQALLSVYDAMGGTEDWLMASSTGTAGFGNVGSGFDEHTVDTTNTPMMLQWRPNATGGTQMLCGMRLRYWTPPVFGTFMPLIQR